MTEILLRKTIMSHEHINFYTNHLSCLKVSCLHRGSFLSQLECYLSTQTGILFFLNRSFFSLFVCFCMFLFFYPSSWVKQHHAQVSSTSWYSFDSLESRGLISSDSVNKNAWVQLHISSHSNCQTSSYFCFL